MANGLFGNPLTTGVALTFDVDMTPYDNMLKRNAAKAAEKAKADKDLLDKYNEYAKNITVDFDKIHWRLHPPARAKYAEALAELNKAVMNKDVHAANMIMMDSHQFNSNLVQRTSEWNEIFNQDPTKVYYDPSIKQKINDRSIPSEDTQITEIFTKYGTPDELLGSLQKAPSRRDMKTDVDNLLKGSKRRLQPGDKPIMYLPTGEAVYEPKYTNKDEVRNQVIMDYTSPQNINSTIFMLMEDYGMSPSELQGKDIPETQQKLTAAIDRVFDPIWSSIESEQYKSRPPRETQPKTGADFIGGIGMKQTGAGETVSMQIPNYEALRKDSSPLVSGIISQVTDENKIKKLNRNLAPSGVQFENVIDSPFDDKNYVSINYGGESKEFVIGDEASVKGAVDWLVKKGISDAQLEEFTKEMGVDVPKSSRDLINFTDQIRIQSTGKTDISKKFTLPAGDIIAKGTSGAKKVNIKNKIPVSGASIDNIGVDESGKLWATISYPVKEDDDVLTKLFGNKNDIESFKKSAGSLPTTFIVPYDEDIKSTVLSLDKNMTEALLDQKLSALKGASGTQSSEYTQITKLKDASGNSINAGVKGGKWYNIDTGEEIK